MSWFVERLGGGQDILVLPGAFDALSAKLIAEAGSEAIYCGGFATTSSQHGLPDLGLLGLSDMVEIYRRMSRAVPAKPLIVDGDGGHGGLLNVERTVDLLAEAGIEACHIEDQIAPKRCGHLSGKDVVDRSEAIARVRTAVVASAEVGPAIIARTDAIAVHGFEEAVYRGNAFLENGAAAVFVDAPVSMEQIEQIPQRIDGPVIFNAAPTGTGPKLKTADLAQLGYACVIHPIEALIASVSSVKSEIGALLGCPVAEPVVDFSSLNKTLGTKEFLEREQQLAMPI